MLSAYFELYLELFFFLHEISGFLRCRHTLYSDQYYKSAQTSLFPLDNSIQTSSLFFFVVMEHDLKKRWLTKLMFTFNVDS